MVMKSTNSGICQALPQATKLFPIVLLVCNAGAAATYAAAGDYRRSLYWIASAVCIAVVTF